MRRLWVIVSMAAFALAACSQHQPATPPPAPATAPAPAPTAPASPAPSESAPPAASPTPAQPPAPASLKPQVVQFSPADYGVHERRVAALIANAESRDTSGETKALAAEGRAQRERCTTKACIESSYGAEEAKLRKWEGAGDIK